MNKDAVFEATRRRMHEWYGSQRTFGRCLYWMHAGIVSLAEHGIESVPAAGSAEWRTPTARWAFEWEGKDTPDRVVPKGYDPRKALPEMHCWILTRDGCFVDFSLCELNATIKAITEEEWTEIVVPSYLWCPVHAMPPGFIYSPSMAATKLAVATIVSAAQEQET